jgi:hypothetical protein
MRIAAKTASMSMSIIKMNNFGGTVLAIILLTSYIRVLLPAQSLPASDLLLGECVKFS